MYVKEKEVRGRSKNRMLDIVISDMKSTKILGIGLSES